MRYRHILFSVLAIATLQGCSSSEEGASGSAASDQGLSVGDAGRAGTSETGDQGKNQERRDWPNWLGPDGDGISKEPMIVSQWPDEGPARRWTANVGTGFSSLSVVNHRLFTMGYEDKQEHVVCLDALTGTELWKYPYDGELVAKMHEGGPAATPAVDDGRVFALGKEGQFHCLDAGTGKPIWSKALQEDLGVDLPVWGFACSPLVIGDLVVVEAGRTAAYSKRTGKKIWQTAKYVPGYGSAHRFEYDRQVFLAVLNNEYLMVLRADDGHEVAKEKWETNFETNATTPISRDGRIFVSSGYGKGCGQFRFNGKTLEFVYENKDLRNHFSNCVLLGDRLFGIDGQTSSRRNCQLVCMDWETGAVRWKHRGLGCGSVFVAGDRLIVFGDQGRLVVVDPTGDDYKELAGFEALDGKCWTVPVLAGGRIYCRNAAGDLACYQLTDSIQ